MGFLDRLFGRGKRSARKCYRQASRREGKGDLDGAIALLDEAIRLDPQFAEAYCDRGWHHLAKDMYDEAFADFTKAIESNPNYPLAYHNRGVAYSKLQDWDSTIADYTKTLELEPDHPWTSDNLINAYVSRAGSLQKKGRFDEALADYDRALKLDPDSSSTYLNRGIAYFDQSIYDKAVADFTKAIQVEKTWVGLFERGRAYCYNGRYPEAIADLTAALDLRPDNPHVLQEIYLVRAKAYQAEKRHDRAIADLTDVIGMVLIDSEPYMLRGSSHAETGRLDQAIADFTQAIRIQATPDAYRCRATAYGKKGQFAQALADYTEFIELRPEEPAGYRLRAQTYRALGDDRKAALDDTHAQAAVCLGQALERLHNSDWDPAISLSTEVIRLDPNQPKGYMRRGIAYLGRNEPDRALADFNYALENLPSLPSTVRALVEEKRAQACRALGNAERPTAAEASSFVLQSATAINYPMRRAAPPAETEGEAEPLSAHRVASRAMVLSAIVCRALLEQEHTSGIREHADGRTALLSWIDELGLRSELEPEEFDFLATPVGQASERQTIDAYWRKEGLCVLAWALGRFPLPPYDQPTDPDAAVQSVEFLSVHDASALRESARLRPDEEIRRFASQITIVHWRIRSFQLDTELVAPSVQFDVQSDRSVQTDKDPVLRKPAGSSTGIGESMDFAGYLRRHPRFKEHWLDHLRLIDGDLAVGDRGIADAYPPRVGQCRSIAVERQIAAYWLEGDDVTYSRVAASTVLSSR